MSSSGQSFVYVIPCRDEDILKLGFSRDPLNRFQSLHPRYFAFFDFDEAFLIETDTVREARAIELRLRRELKLHNAPAPLLVAKAAGGHTEWYRGALEHLTGAAIQHEQLGHVVHRPLREWMRTKLAVRGNLLFHWSAQMLEAIAAEHGNPGESQPPTTLEWTLRNALDAFTAFDLRFDDLVSNQVVQWHASNDSRFR